MKPTATPKQKEIKQVQPAEVVFKYKYQGQEWENELSKNTYAYQWRDYDPAIARFNKIDRFAEKYVRLTPYHFAANSPMYFREMAGDSLNITKIYKRDEYGNYKNPTQVAALEFFASTKIGKKFLSLYAAKGQKVGKVVFNKNGKFHNKKIDLNFDTNLSKGDGRSGETGVEIDKNNRFQITISLGNEKNNYNAEENLVPEFFIHALKFSLDIIDNGKLDNSNIKSSIKKEHKTWQWQHYQEDYEARNNKSYFAKYGYPILIKANTKFHKYEKNTQIWDSMWDFVY